MKLSFSLNSKSSSITTDKPKPPNNFTDEEEENSPTNTPSSNPEFITEFNPSQPLTPTHHQQQPNLLIIPPLPNTWKPHNHLNFESLSTSTTTDSVTTTYGLNLRPKKEIDNGSDGNVKSESLDWKLLQKLREDIRNLPDDKGLEEFVDVPVEGYGKAVLAGYGWCEGRGIGKNAKEDVKVVEYKGRTGRQGLGFVPQAD